MYNRYIPQSDGSYRRRRVIDNPSGHQPNPHQNHIVNQRRKPQQSEPAPKEIYEKEEDRHTTAPNSKQEKSISSFLRQLLPNGLDTGDLLVILLLLLMAGDSSEEHNTAMLTLAFYLFM